MNGWLVIDKPLGLTSTQVGSRLKRLLKIKKIGHLGTLDPLASGVLALALGEATKVIPYIKNDRKVYECEITFGEERSTDDSEGEIVATSLHRPSLSDIQKALPYFVGTIQQRPPAFSAIHVQGKRAYDLARQGQYVDLPLRNVHIDRIEVIGSRDASVALRVTCKSGVYIRSLGRDLAKNLGTLGYISRLKRVQDGCFFINNAFSLEKIAEMMDKLKVWDMIQPMETVLDDIPVVSVSQGDVDRLRVGQSVQCFGEDTDVVWIICDETPICLAQRYGSFLIPKRVFK